LDYEGLEVGLLGISQVCWEGDFMKNRAKGICWGRNSWVETAKFKGCTYIDFKNPAKTEQ